MKTNKLIKLSDTHYIIVDDSEIKAGDWFYNTFNDNQAKIQQRMGNWRTCFNEHKITHSTQPLGKALQTTSHKQMFGIEKEIKPLSLSEVEELIYGYSVENLAKYHYGNHRKTREFEDGFMLGFQLAHKELVKDKLFTTQDVIDIVEKSRETGLTAEYFITKYLLPKTEWIVTFDENNKLKLV